jgi:hypothetical protein
VVPRRRIVFASGIGASKFSVSLMPAAARRSTSDAVVQQGRSIAALGMMRTGGVDIEAQIVRFPR